MQDCKPKDSWRSLGLTVGMNAEVIAGLKILVNVELIVRLNNIDVNKGPLYQESSHLDSTVQSFILETPPHLMH